LTEGRKEGRKEGNNLSHQSFEGWKMEIEKRLKERRKVDGREESIGGRKEGRLAEGRLMKGYLKEGRKVDGRNEGNEGNNLSHPSLKGWNMEMGRRLKERRKVDGRKGREAWEDGRKVGKRNEGRLTEGCRKEGRLTEGTKGRKVTTCRTRPSEGS
jgi:hypothetical protein